MDRQYTMTIAHAGRESVLHWYDLPTILATLPFFVREVFAQAEFVPGFQSLKLVHNAVTYHLTITD